MVIRRTGRHDDRGAVLVLTLILTVVLAVIVVALAEYVTVGLKTSDTATERTETHTDSSNVMSWAIEQFAKKRLTPDADCDDAPDYATIAVPAALVSNGSTTTLECAQTEPISGEPVVHLVATSVDDQTRVVESTVEVPAYVHGARVSDWRVDIPIAVPPYVTTTTVVAGTTTTTTTTVANTAPTANATGWVVNPSTTTTAYLDAFDTDGTIVSATVAGAPGTWTVTPTGGTEVQLTVDGATGTFPLSYTVTDDDGAMASSTITVEVTSTATTTTTSTTTTTTTTLPPNLTCTFKVTATATDNKSGTGNLSIMNLGGGPFTGWQVRITQLNTKNPWSFTWDDAVTATSGSSLLVSGSQSVGADGVVNFTAGLTWNGGEPKIVANQDLPCVRVWPSP